MFYIANTVITKVGYKDRNYDDKK